MSRAPFQVLIIPFRIAQGQIPEFAVTKRSDMDVWQFLAGGGEDVETPMQAARREAMEEGKLPSDCNLIKLDSIASIPGIYFAAYKEWGDDIFVIPEYAFGVDVEDNTLSLSSEHTEIQWLHYKEADAILTWDSNKTALWELNERITQTSRNF
jgi:dATP pyrophosphohydrolase